MKASWRDVDGLHLIVGDLDALRRPGRDTLAHEVGHAWTYLEFGTKLDSDAWKAWIRAKNDDVISTSTYAQSSIIDDGAETVLAFVAARSHGGESGELYQDLKALFPRRWQILEQKCPE